MHDGWIVLNEFRLLRAPACEPVLEEGERDRVVESFEAVAG